MAGIPEFKEYPFPENLGCTYGDPDGKMCAELGCWAKVIIEELRGYGEEAIARMDKVKANARIHGCPHFAETQ